MPIEQITEKTIHLERTSESDAEPARWVIAQIQSKLDALPAGVRDDVKFHGWRDSRLTYPHRMSDLELAQARNSLLVQHLQAGITRGSLSRDELLAALAEAGLAP